MGFSISVASAADVQLMARWAAEEGWNPGTTDCHAFFATDPAGFLMGRLDGRPATCISVVRYDGGVGFLGMYIARPEVRGQGLGYLTWQAGMARMSGCTVGLDGVPAQQANYQKSGFRLLWNTVRFEGAAPTQVPPSGVDLVHAGDVPFDLLETYDRRHFGAARACFLAAWITLPQRWALAALRDGELVGFAVLRTAQTSARIGPLFAESTDIAAALVSQLAHESGATSVAVDVPSVNPRAVAWAEETGLRASFATARMYTGDPPDFERAEVFGVTSLELG